MINKSRFSGSVLAAFVAVMMLAVPVAGNAQETTGSIRGTVTGPDGSPISGAEVTLTDTRTASSRTMSTNSAGIFSQGGLRIGGPYQISISAPDHADQTVTDINIGLGDTYTMVVALSTDSIEEIVVTAQQIGAVAMALGPSATFSLQDLQDAPAINRTITDVVKVDSRMYVDEGGNRGDAIYCGGAHPRFNSLTIDGVRMNDQFGLNSNGFPTSRQPFPYDAIQTVAVEMAPFDVQYGGFTACNINAVTKSGTNEFHGSVFYDYTDDSFKGDVINGGKIDLGDFEEKRYGVSFGGPILKDKLFFFAGYEKLDGTEIFARGTVDSTAAVQVGGVTQAQLDRIAQVARDTYGYEVGPILSTAPVEDEKILLRLDWDINDQHRAAYTYMWNDGFNVAEADGFSNAIEFSDHYYERGAELTSHVAQLISNWTDNFSTEFRISKNELDNRQLSRGIVAGQPVMGEVQIRTYGPTGQSATVFLGADDSRHSNDLDWDTLGFKLTAAYTAGNHTVSGGWERDELNVFNLFVQETEGEFEFESSAYCSAANPDGCIDQFELGSPDDITYENAAPSNDPNDAAALWAYEINSLYIQDEVVAGDLTIVAGLRYDWYTSSDLPVENPNFIARNGYTNADNFDGVDLLQPRLGINWDYSPDLSFRGGVGLYSGGNPNVWLSNNYSNNGITQVEARRNYVTGGNSVLPGNPGGLVSLPNAGGGLGLLDIPQAMVDQVGGGSPNAGVNAVDPDFESPSSWKYAIGGSWNFDAGKLGDGYRLDFDYQLSKMDNAAIIVDATLERIGTAIDGRPLYRNIDRADRGDGIADFGCYTDGTYTTLDPTSPNCGSRAFNSDYILTNTVRGDTEQETFTLGLSKGYDWGLDWMFAYTHTESDDVNPMTSSVAFSNYAQVALSDPNDPGSATTNYLIPERFTLRVNFRRAFFGDNMTKFTLYGYANEGRPFSYTYENAGNIFGDRIDDRHLLYIPSGPSDPNVVFGAGFDQAAFFSFLDSTGLSAYGGSIAPRNFTQGPWWTRFDFKVEQEFPGFNSDHKASAFLLIKNLGNLLNEDWGILKESSFPRYQQAVVLSGAGFDAQGRYEYNSFQQPAAFVPNPAASLYEIRFGVNYSF
ncbi:MAG: TonB-dependent receptor [Gammaproteobacteria bacterium]|nr:TonB-dependent receptor [Gammaproteobacteria bacterium]MDH5584670.1 TonB-dependent receptor [Gammaproteobacteria bacterium]